MKRNQRKFAEHGGQARVLAAVSYRVVRPLLYVILALGSMFWMPIASFARVQLAAPCFNAGYSPSSMNTADLPQSQIISYDKNFVANLKANTPWMRVCERRELPENSGNQLKLFMYQTLQANAVQAPEGTVGSGIKATVVSNLSTIGQYSDYINVSDLALKTTLDPALENLHKELAYRLALTLNQLVRITADGANAIDSSVSALSKAYNAPFNRTDITSAVQSLAGRQVKPFQNGAMAGVIHPFIVGDALNDSANNGVTDILKRSPEGRELLSELPSPDGDETPVLDWAGVRFHQSTLVTTTANYQSQSGKTALRTYIVGQDALIAISLGKMEGSQIGEGDWRNMKLYIKREPEPSKSDPSGMIGGWTSYNVKQTFTLPPDTTMRERYIDAVSNIA